MNLRILSLLFLPAALLLGQTKTFPLTGPDGKPIMGKDGKPATVTMEAVSPPPAGPDLSTLPPDKVLISVGDEKITAAELSIVIQTLPEQLRASALGPARKSFAENVVRMKLLAAEARRRKIDQTPAFKTQQAFQLDNLLAGLVYQDMAKTLPVTDEQERAWFAQHISDYEKVRARHILIRMKGSPVPVKPDQKDLTEAEALAKAQELRQKLLAGADFASVAKTESDDTTSAAKGGELGLVAHGQMVPSFEEAAFKTPPGQLSEPVKSQYGYHIIKVEEKQSRTFEEVRAEVSTKLRAELIQKTLAEMRKNATVAFDPTFFGAEPVLEVK
jgi:peptidyl-prolyl cis-trans isomerase C